MPVRVGARAHLRRDTRSDHILVPREIHHLGVSTVVVGHKPTWAADGTE
jgi:hypothetical protein